MNLYETVRQVAEQAAIRVLARRGAPIWAVVTQTDPLRISVEDSPGSGPDGVPTMAELAATALPYTPMSLVAGLAIGDRVKCELLDGQLVISGRVGGSAGQAGPPGPANRLTIGSVNSGPAPDASITGDPPEQALHLVLPKGDTGDSGYAVFANYSALKAAMPNPPDGTPAWTTDGIDWRWRTALGKWAVVNTPVFDTAADRNAAIPEPTIGARSLIGAGLSEQVYSGTAWVSVGIPPAAAKLVRDSDLPTSGSSWTTMPFRVDLLSGALTATTTQITVTNAGVYMVMMSVIWSNTAHRRLAEVRVNGNGVPGGMRVELNASGYMSGGVGGLVPLAAGDQVSAAYYAAGGTLQAAHLSILRSM